MKIRIDDTYESIAAEYQYRLIAKLDEVLQRHGIDRATRENICGEYAFDSGMLHDQGNIEVQGESYSIDVGFRKGDLLFVRCESFAFHEYAHGNAGAYFES